MMKSKVRAIALVLSVCTQLVACIGDVTGQGVQEIGATCGASDDCRPGLECELEHGRGTCQEHGSTGRSSGGDASSPRDAASSSGPSSRDDSAGRSDAGTDADDSSDSGSDSGDSGSDSGGGASGASCVTAADCASGLECEEEHGVSTCQPHGHGGRD